MDGTAKRSPEYPEPKLDALFSVQRLLLVEFPSALQFGLRFPVPFWLSQSRVLFKAFHGICDRKEGKQANRREGKRERGKKEERRKLGRKELM